MYPHYHARYRPDWRWRLATSGASHPDQHPASERKLLRLATRYQKARADCRSAADRERLGRNMPVLDGVHALHQSANLSDILQARLLARETTAAIAAAMNLSTDVVGLYEFFYFDVAELLESPDRIRQLIGAERQPWSERTALLYCAYFGGSMALQAFLNYSAARPRNLKAALAFIVETALAQVTNGLLTARGGGQSGSRSPAELQNLLRQLHGAEANETELEKHISVFVNSFKYDVGGMTPSPLGDLDNQAAELRDDEVMALGSGQLKPEDLAHLKDITFQRQPAATDGSGSASSNQGTPEDRSVPAAKPSPATSATPATATAASAATATATSATQTAAPQPASAAPAPSPPRAAAPERKRSCNNYAELARIEEKQRRAQARLARQAKEAQRVQANQMVAQPAQVEPPRGASPATSPVSAPAGASFQETEETNVTRTEPRQTAPPAEKVEPGSAAPPAAAAAAAAAAARPPSPTLAPRDDDIQIYVPPPGA